MTADTKVADLPAKWRAKAKRIRGMTAGSDLAADIMDVAAEDLEAALARQEADMPSTPVGQADANDLVAALKSICGRMIRALPPKFGDGFDGDFDTLLAAAEWIKRNSRKLSLTQPAAQADDDWHLRGYAYASKQATTCAGCGEHKHTPLRIDAMGGYVCLTCIDNKLSSLLGEFGYTSAQAVDLGKIRHLADEIQRDASNEIHSGGWQRACNHFGAKLSAIIDQQDGKDAH